MIDLRLREIGPTLSDPSQPATDVPGVVHDDQNVWRDSSIDLEQGLEVVELSVDLHVCDVPAPVPPLLHSLPKRH